MCIRDSIRFASDTSLTATTSTQYDSYILFLNAKKNKKTDRNNVASVTFDNNIKAVMYGQETGKKTVGTMNFEVSGNKYGGSEKKRGFEHGASSKTTESDWFSFSGKTITCGAKNDTPGDYLRIIVDAASPPAVNRDPVASNSTQSVTENEYAALNGGYGDVITGSEDPDGDTVTITKITYDKFTDSNSNDKVDSGEIEIGKEQNLTTGWNSFNTKYGNLFIHTDGRYCLLYTSPSPRDRTRSRMPSSA